MINKIKKKYQSDIFILKNQINGIIQLYQNNIVNKRNDIKININKVKNSINQINKMNQWYKESINKLNQELKIKENDNLKLKDELNKLKISYNELSSKSESSELILNGKVEKEKMKIKDNINQIKNK